MDVTTKLSIIILAEGIIANVYRIRTLRRPPTYRAESLLARIVEEAKCIRGLVGNPMSQKAPLSASAEGEAKTASNGQPEPSH